MTTKEIAEAVGKKERTIHYWLESLSAINADISAKIAEARATSKPADYTLDETVLIIEVGMGRNAADLFRMSAMQKEVSWPKPAEDFATTLQILARTLERLACISESQENRLQKIEGKIEQRQALLPAPQVKSRDNVSRIVRKYAHDRGIEYALAWNMLYNEYSYRTNTNPRLSAKNRYIATIDYIESEGMMGTLEAVAIDWGNNE